MGYSLVSKKNLPSEQWMKRVYIGKLLGWNIEGEMMWDKLRFQIFLRRRCELQFVPNSNGLGRRVVRFRAKEELWKRLRHLENLSTLLVWEERERACNFAGFASDKHFQGFPLLFERCIWKVWRRERGVKGENGPDLWNWVEVVGPNIGFKVMCWSEFGVNEVH